MWCIPLGLFLVSLFVPGIAGWVFIALYILLQGYLFLIDSARGTPSFSEWTPDELDTLRKYHLALRFPFGSKFMSIQLNGFRWSGLLLMAPLLLWNHMWIPAAVSVVSFFLTASLSVRLDPFFYLEEGLSGCNRQPPNNGRFFREAVYTKELALLRRVSAKLAGAAEHGKS